MSEFHTDKSKEFAKDSGAYFFNEARQYHTSLAAFIQKIFDDYEQAPDGHFELLRLQRIARFIAQQPADSSDNDAQALFIGQLVGLQVLNYTYPKNAPLADVTHSFVQNKLIESRKIIAMQEKETAESGLRVTAESPADQVARVRATATTIRESFSLPRPEYPFSHAHEGFIQSIASELYGANGQLHNLTKVGFRMTLQQYEKSNAKITEHTGIQTLDNLDALEEVDSLEEYVTITDINDIRNDLLRMFKDLKKPSKDLDLENDAIAGAVIDYIQTGLEQYNTDERLIEHDDILFINGDFIAIVSDENSERFNYVYFKNHTEIRGTFTSIEVVETPTHQELQQLNEKKYGGIDDYEPQTSTLSPALQIINPVLLTYDGENSTPVSDPAIGLTIDIPLIYTGIHIQRLRAPGLDTTDPVEDEPA
jgi:hypothetical protein